LGNPCLSAIIIHLVGYPRLEIIITDVNGKQLQKQTAQMVAGSNLVPLNTSKLAAGSYQVTIITQDGDKSTLRFVKQ